MDIRTLSVFEFQKCKNQAIALLYTKYEEEMKHLPFLKYMSADEFWGFVVRCISRTKIVAGFENDQLVGVLLYSIWDNDDKKRVTIPIYGYGSISEKEDEIIGRLFQYIAANEVKQGTTVFSTHIYAHDEPIRQLFSFMQFGTMAEKCVRKLTEQLEIKTHYHIQSLTKGYIEEKWDKLWSLTKNIIDHLKESPIFYAGNEFTEELYQTFYLSEGTTVYAAYDDFGKIIGIIETNTEENKFVFGHERSVNIGEVYVLPEYRRTGLAHDLLCYAENHALSQDAAYMWVEHGTANPNARGFWNKYFDTYQYEMIRQIVC